jgi:hypothetical protein
MGVVLPAQRKHTRAQAFQDIFLWAGPGLAGDTTIDRLGEPENAKSVDKDPAQ